MPEGYAVKRKLSHSIGRAGLLGRWREWRNRLLAQAGFQRWAAGFPMTRPVASRRARALFDLVAGFVYSQVLFACVRLGLLPMLADGPLDVPAVARRVALPEAGALRLLRAAATLDLVEPRAGGLYGLGAQGAALLGNPGISAMVEHHAMLYADLADPVALLRGEGGPTELSRYWSYAVADRAAGLSEEQVAAYSELMSASQALVAGDILDAYSLKRHSCLLDVGGGEGNFLRAAGERWPRLRLMLFDLPSVAERARERLSRAGLGDRATAIGGDLFHDNLPRGADLISLVRVVHDHDDHAAAAILRGVRRTLPPGGTLLLAEPMSATPGAEPVGDAYFGFYLLAMGSGRPRTPRELFRMLSDAGFQEIRLRRTRRPMLTRLVTARTT
jgi:demethylspheroidene O-methyltransferase